MTHWWLPRFEPGRTAGLPEGYFDCLLGEFIIARYPKKVVEIRQIIRSDGTLVEISSLTLSIPQPLAGL